MRPATCSVHRSRRKLNGQRLAIGKQRRRPWVDEQDLVVTPEQLVAHHFEKTAIALPV